MKRNWLYIGLVGAAAVLLLLWMADQALETVLEPDIDRPAGRTDSLPEGTPAREMPPFPSLRGPSHATAVAPPLPTDWLRYSSGGTNRLAVLLTKADSDWLTLAHGLRAIGLPFLLTTNTAQALAHRVVFVYPELSGAVLDGPTLRALAAHPRTGGTLIAANVLGAGFEELFGFREAVASTSHYEIGFSTQHALTAAFTHPHERVFRVADPGNPGASAGNHHYTNPAVPPLAVYEDGSAAILLRPWEAGYACALGFDPGYLLAVGYHQREAGVARARVNQFEPSLDVLLRFFKELYAATATVPVTLGTVPFGRKLPVVITHDVSYSRSVSNALAYAEYEAGVGVRATYFIQAKYLRDFNDAAFFDAEIEPVLQRLRVLGHELASHTVCRSLRSASLPLGTGTESFPDYQPQVRSPLLTLEASLLGELRVSKFLLEQLGGQEIVSFRPGLLSLPGFPPQTLAATGYRFSSSVTANDSLTHLPFQLDHDRRPGVATPVFEFPVALEDEEKPALHERLPQAINLAHQLARYGGLMNILIQPDILGHKLQFEREFIVGVQHFA